MKKKIEILDKAIKKIESFQQNFHSDRYLLEIGEKIKYIAHQALIEAGSSPIIISDVNGVSFELERVESSALCFAYGDSRKEMNDMFRRNLKCIIAILNKEKERLRQMVKDEEQKESLRLQSHAKYLSIIALIIAFISLLVSIFK